MIRDWDNYADSAMDWSWLRGAFAHPTIRPSDADGKVHRQGRILQFEAKLWIPPFPAIPFPTRNELDWCPNTSYLWLVHDPFQWGSDHRPTRLTHYRVAPNVWPLSDRWSARGWQELGDNWAAAVRDMCLEWATWAVDTQAEWWTFTRAIRAATRDRAVS